MREEALEAQFTELLGRKDIGATVNPWGELQKNNARSCAAKALIERGRCHIGVRHDRATR